MSLINTPIKPFKNMAFKNGEFIEVTEKDTEGKWSIFFFYPADFTFVCPTELGDLADHYDEFQKMGVDIYSVSTDTHFTHKAWHSSSETIGKIKYAMIGDPTGALTRNFENMRELEGLADRGTFVVDPQGIIQAIEITAEGIGRDASDLLRKVKAAQYVASHPVKSALQNGKKVKRLCLRHWTWSVKFKTPLRLLSYLLLSGALHPIF